MASLYDPIRGLHVRHAFAKSVHKGEDTWSQKRDVPACKDKEDGGVTLDFFGVYDGHGGKQAASYASRQLLDVLLAKLPAASKAEAAARTKMGDQDSDIPQELLTCKQLREEDWDLWQAQEEAVGGLPMALSQAFQQVEKDFYETAKVSGSTATVALLLGWELIVANVGDSCAYLDTGSEVLQVSGNHRLDDNKVEQERIKGQGFEVSPTTLEGKPCGPLRVWPGGLAMARTIGDYDAGEVVLSEPEVRQVTLPATGGRIIIASDGLWDAMAPKTAAHHIRGMPASKAAGELVKAALKAKGLRDDITVLVVDASPGEEHRLPPPLAKDGGGHLQAERHPPVTVNVYHPLEDGEVGRAAWRRLLWDRRLEAVQATWPEAFLSEQELKMLNSGGFSLESSGTMLASSGEPAEDSVSENGSTASDASETLSIGLGNNPFALVDGEEFPLESHDSAWETVPPKPSKKHSLPLANEGSPPEAWQIAVPKARKEAPPSPIATSALSRDSGASSIMQGGGRRRGMQNGRGRGRAGNFRGTGGRVAGRDQYAVPISAQQGHPEPVSGFQVVEQPLTNQGPPCDARAPSGLSFLDGGGFSFGPQTPPQTPAPIFQAGAGPPEGPRRQRATSRGRGNAAGRGRGRGRRDPGLPEQASEGDLQRRYSSGPLMGGQQSDGPKKEGDVTASRDRARQWRGPRKAAGNGPQEGGLDVDPSDGRVSSRGRGGGRRGYRGGRGKPTPESVAAA